MRFPLRFRWFSVIALLVSAMAACSKTEAMERRVSVEEAMRRANDYFRLNHSLSDAGLERILE